MTATDQFANLAVSLAVAVISAVASIFIPLLMAKLHAFVKAKVNADHQRVIYNAVKIAERAAAQYGFTWSKLAGDVKAAIINDATRYAQTYGITLNTALLDSLIAAENTKQRRIEEANIAAFAAPLTPPSTDGV
ncbi:MAG TPA: hypothetical protein VGE32_02990 [Cellvibrio sp.]